MGRSLTIRPDLDLGLDPDPDLAALGDRLVRVAPVVRVLLDLADLDLVVDLVVPELTSRVGPAAPDLTGRVDLVDRADLVAPVVPDLTGRVDLAGPVDHRRRHTRPGVPTIAVAPH